jgi:hypothetical protein
MTPHLKSYHKLRFVLAASTSLPEVLVLHESALAEDVQVHPGDGKAVAGGGAVEVTGKNMGKLMPVIKTHFAVAYPEKLLGSWKAKGCIWSMLSPLSQKILAAVALRIWFSCSGVKEPGFPLRRS